MAKIIIIGGGIAGLTAGVYAQKAGFESVIYEKHSIAGGECTGWDRQGFHIDGCIHWLVGTREGTDLNQLWRDVGGLGDIEIYQPDSFATVKLEGQTVTLHRDLNKLRKHLIDVAPEDKAAIEDMCRSVAAFHYFEPPCRKPLDLMGKLEMVRFGFGMRKVAGQMKKLSKMTVGDYVQRFKHPAIRAVLQYIVPADLAAHTLVFSLGAFISGNAGKPAGGSKAFADRIVARYKSLGGCLKLGTTVEEIIVEEGTARGVVLAGGIREYADFIVPACDANITFKTLLKGRYSDEEFDKRYADKEAYPLRSSVQIALAVDADLSSYPESYLFPAENLSFEDGQLDFISLKHYCYEPSFAPAGKSVVISYIEADYEWWKNLYGKGEKYRPEKQRLAAAVVKEVETHFPELQGKVRVLDVATPITYERYCGAYRGSWMSFGNTPQGKALMHDGLIEGLDNLYMAGQWLMSPGGLPSAAVTGKWAIDRINKHSKVAR